MKRLQPSTPRGNGALGPAIGFILAGFVSLVSFALLLWWQPHWLLDPSAQVQQNHLVALLMVGWMGSMVFGIAYHVVPMLAGLPWWSRRLPWLHLGLHVTGLGWLAAILVGGYAGSIEGGALLLVAGLLLFILNQQVTSGRLSLWEPASITFTHAMFWLLVTAVLWTAAQWGWADRFTHAAPDVLQHLIVRLGVVGVLLLGLLGAALKLIPMFLVSPRGPGLIAWFGGATLSLGLYGLVVAHLGGFPRLMRPAEVCIGLGTTLYLLELLRLAWGARRAWGWDLAISGVGLVLLVLWVAWSLEGRPIGALLPDQATWQVAIGLLGPATFLIVGMAARLVPLLCWTLAFATRAGRAPVPAVETLSRGTAWVPLALVLTLAWGYLVAGIALQEKTGLTFAGACLVVAVLIFAVAVAPALRALLSRRPALPAAAPLRDALA